MIQQKDIESLIEHLYKEAGEYRKLGGTNEAWGLVYAGKKLEKLIKAARSGGLTADDHRAKSIEPIPT